MVPSFTGVAPITLHCHSAADKLPYPQMPVEAAAKEAPPQDNKDGTGSPSASQPTSPVKGKCYFNLGFLAVSLSVGWSPNYSLLFNIVVLCIFDAVVS